MICRSACGQKLRLADWRGFQNYAFMEVHLHLMSSKGRKRLKENYVIERMPRCDSFNLFYCGSIAGKPAIYNGYKNEK
ncbi:MAG: hypothetical protein RHS_4685 [Robinsoniella sp. RHS]|nr:MAG: hypothetical protein RHS_4685 [Robinsoniella sp. RHS]